MRFLKDNESVLVWVKTSLALLLFLALILVALALGFLILTPTEERSASFSPKLSLEGFLLPHEEEKKKPEVLSFRYYTDGPILPTIWSLRAISNSETSDSLLQRLKKEQAPDCLYSENRSVYHELNLVLSVLELKTLQKPDNKELKKLVASFNEELYSLEIAHDFPENFSLNPCLPYKTLKDRIERVNNINNKLKAIEVD